LNRGEVGIAALCREFGLYLDLRGLLYTGHWLTPPGMPKRWDARFFTTRAPAGQVAVADGGEAQSLLWVQPQGALQPDSGLKLLPAMRHTLGELIPHADTEAVLRSMAARTQVPRHMPRRGRTSAGLRIVLPTELAYAEVGRLDPEGRGDVLVELRHGTPVRLSPNLWRLTASNPGPMTGPGTNSYLVGAGEEWTVIDPGPADPVHLQALLDAAAAAGGRITRILATHTHRDHSPGAMPLAAATGAPVWGRIAAHADWQDSSFEPVHQPVHGETIDCAPGVQLRVLHTPGHASNHLCFLLTEASGERLLFTGDHVMQGSTVVINPPDGDMGVYLASLQALLDEPLDWLAPGHGFLVAQPHDVLRALIAHRLKREAKVAAVLAGVGPASIDSLLPQVYDDVPAALHGVARRSLLAHLLKLQQEGAAQCHAERWHGVTVA
jgi:glyoxylase-like metal-dependent hydrolase (beta-lactamase superfamily II)